jgi:hypothetical protein
MTGIRPPGSGDHNGLSAFYLVIGWDVCLLLALVGRPLIKMPFGAEREAVRADGWPFRC